MTIILLTIASIIIIILFYNYYHTRQINKKVVQQCYEKCKINRYEKIYYENLGIWSIKDRLNNTRPMVSVYTLPDDIAEEIIDYSLKLIEEGEMK